MGVLNNDILSMQYLNKSEFEDKMGQLLYSMLNNAMSCIESDLEKINALNNFISGYSRTTLKTVYDCTDDFLYQAVDWGYFVYEEFKFDFDDYRFELPVHEDNMNRLTVNISTPETIWDIYILTHKSLQLLQKVLNTK